MKIDYDYCIVGCGVSGTYLGSELNKTCRGKKILFIDKKDYVGGRLNSITGPKNQGDIRYELGGMRFFEAIHPLVVELIKELGLESVVVPESPPTNITQLRSLSIENKELFSKIHGRYFLKENANKLFPKLNKIIENEITKMDKSSSLNDMVRTYAGRKKLFATNELTGKSFMDVVFNNDLGIGLSSEQWDLYNDILNYNDVFKRSINFVIAAIENLALNGVDSPQLFVVDGYNMIAKKLLKNVLNDNKHAQYYPNTELITFDEKSDCTQLSIKTNNKTYNITVSELFLCIPQNEVSHIDRIPADYISLYRDNIIQYDLFKMFITYPKAFLKDKNITQGRNKTSSPLNQCWLYNEGADTYTILIYAVSNLANYWKPFLPSKNQDSFRDFNKKTDEQLISLVNNNLKEVFGLTDKEIPQPTQLAYHYWYNGFGAWNSFDKHSATSTRSIPAIQSQLIYPFGKDKNIVYLNNDISFNQGWVEGCLEIVNDYMEERKIRESKKDSDLFKVSKGPVSYNNFLYCN